MLDPEVIYLFSVQKLELSIRQMSNQPE